MLVNKDREKEKYLFQGIEVEGPLAGKATLFVSDDVPASVIKTEYIKICPRSEHIYFGANHLSRINLETVLEISDLSCYITLEIADWDEFYSLLSSMKLADKERFISMLVLSRVFIMCCLYKGPLLETLANNSKILNVPYTEGPLQTKSPENLLVKIETDLGVFVSPVLSFSQNLWDAYKTDTTVWQESVNSNIPE